MYIYIVLFVLTVVCCFFEYNYSSMKIVNHKIKVRNIVATILMVFFLLIGVLRNELLGVDVKIYKEMFFYNYEWKELLTNFSFDNGYFLLCKIFKLFSSDFYLFKSFIYIVTFYLYYVSVIKKSKYVSISLLIFLGLTRLEGMFCVFRQEIAIAICFFATKYVYKNPKLFILIILLASTIHKTALFYLIILFFNENKFKKINKLKMMLLGISSLIFMIFLLPFVTKLYLNDYSSLLRYDGGLNLLILFILNYIVISFFRKKSLDREINIYYKIFTISIFMQMISLRFSLFTRITNYFSLSLSLIYPDVISRVNKKTGNCILVLLVVEFGFLFFYSLNLGLTQIVPYIFNF